METIMACATPISQIGAIGIIRISGDMSHPVSDKIFVPYQAIDKREYGRMYLGNIVLGNFKDKAFCVWFKAPNTYTGEDICEIQFHGGHAVSRGILRSLAEFGIRVARPGEFTRRAFLNRKITLDEAEGIVDIINASSESALMQASRMASGELAKEIYSCRDLLLEISASIDVILDYPEEISFEDIDKIQTDLVSVQIKLDKLLKNSSTRKYISDGVLVTIAGTPNAGKSSLLNAILKDERAIVSEIPGTTRDVLRESIEINGIRINFADTAGIRETVDTIEKIGVERAKVAIETADLVILVKDLSVSCLSDETELESSISSEKLIVVGNKVDIKKHSKRCDLEISATDGTGIDKLLDSVFDKLKLTPDAAILTRDRHIAAVTNTLKSVELAINALANETPDRVSENVKNAFKIITEITGENASEAVIDKIFSTFCVGK